MPLYLFIFIVFTVILYICMYLSIDAEYKRVVAEQKRLVAMVMELDARRPQMDALVTIQARRDSINRLIGELRKKSDMQFRPEKMAKVLRFQRKILKFPVNRGIK